MPAANLVISFQRSGLNWLRHCVEYFGGVRTPGHSHLLQDGAALFDRTHDVRRKNLRSDFERLYDGDGREIYQRVALLLRDPYDCFVSHYLGRKDISFRRALEDFAAFTANIEAFAGLHQAEKAVFHFDEFINNPSGTFVFLRYFGIDPDHRPYDLAALVKSSREWYRSEHGLIRSEERPQLKPRERAAIRKMLVRNLGANFEKYLGRYH